MPSTRAELVAAVKRRTGLDCTVNVGVYGSWVVSHAQDRYRVSLSIRDEGPTEAAAIEAVWRQITIAWQRERAMFEEAT